MVGDYDMAKTRLFTEKIVGTVTACLGFVREGNYYIPNTVLREDIRNVTTSPQKRILAIFVKGVKENAYKEISYIAKDINVETLDVPTELNGRIILPVTEDDTTAEIKSENDGNDSVASIDETAPSK